MIGELAFAALPGAAALGIWALKDLQGFVIFAVLSAMVLPVALFQPGGAQVGLADVLLVLALGAWLVNVAVGAEQGPWLARNPLLPAFVIFVLINAMSIAWSTDRGATAKSVLQMVEIVLVFTLAFATLPRSVKRLETGMLLFVVTSSVLAVVAFVTAAPDLARGQIEATDLGLGLNKNAAGSYIAAGLVVAYVFLLGETRPGKRRLLGVLIGLESLGMIATLSRGSMLGALAAIVVASVLLRERRLLTIGTTLAVAIVYLAVVGPQGTGGTTVDAEGNGYDSSEVRVYSFKAAVETIKAHPVLGTGSGTYFDDIPELGIGLADPNNMFLLTWAEIGFFGLAALIFLLVRFGMLWWRVAALPREFAVVAVAAGGVALSLFVHFQFDVTWTRGTTSLAFAAIGIMLAAHRLASPEAGPVSQSAIERPQTSSFAAVSESQSRRETRRQLHRSRVTAGRSQSPGRRSSVEPAAIVEAPNAPVVAGSATRVRVLHVVSSNAFAGIERHAVRLCEQLRALDVDAVLLCPPTADRMREEASAAGVPTLPRRGASDRWVRSAARAARALRPDIVHVHDGHSAALASLVAPRSALLVRSQHFMRPASVERSGPTSRVSIAAHRRINRRVAAYIAVSQVAADEAVLRREVDAGRVVVIPPGVRLADKEAVERARATRAAAGATIRLAFAGRFEAEKCVDVLLEGLALARREVPELHAIIAGGGSLEPELRALARRLELNGAVEWLGWVKEPDETFSRAHFYVNPLPEEGFGMAMAEAMSFELPVVAPEAGSSPEVVADGVTGILVPPRDPSGLAAALVRMARDREMIARLGAAGRARAVARFGLQQTAAATADLYAELLKPPAG